MLKLVDEMQNLAVNIKIATKMNIFQNRNALKLFSLKNDLVQYIIKQKLTC